MIKNRLSTILGEKRLNMAEVARGAKISKATVFKIYHERASKIDYAVLDKLCAFLSVQPGDLLIYIPSESKGKTKEGENHRGDTP